MVVRYFLIYYHVYIKLLVLKNTLTSPLVFFFYSVFSSEGSSTYTVFECDLQITEGQEEGEVRGDRDRESKTSLNTILKFLGTMVE